MSEANYNVGEQPIDSVMKATGLTNTRVVNASGEMLTHKVVNKARKGRRLTRRSQEKVLRAVNAAAGDEGVYTLESLFNYKGS